MAYTETEVAIIGAGPYGLALASHLQPLGVEHRVFGIPMENWLTKMPEDMRLKSFGFATNLCDPDGHYTLKRFCESNGLAYDDYPLPIPLRTFCDYGLAFQRRCVPDVDRRAVAAIRQTQSGYRLTLADGEDIRARKVVCAVGISPFAYLPPTFEGLPRELVTHSSHHRRLDRFRGQQVTIVGAGASAIDLAVLLHRAGASVGVVTRRSRIAFGNPVHQPRELWARIRAPMSGIGEGWRSRLCTDAPLLFHVMPQWFRLAVVRQHLGPAAGWFTRDYAERNIPVLANVSVTAIGTQGGRARLDLRRNSDNVEHKVLTDHVIAATGYRVDLSRMAFLDAVKGQIRHVCNTPVLSSTFEASLPGLYFIGPAAANCFGPMLRFVFGSGFAARRLSAHLASRPWRLAARPSAMERPMRPAA
ncbi:MAG TPA: NAD(P)-binding domain-containing protein [Alphaproteobacteria bacterium]|nr:NAD(P)-binding domain-containing protein [Alphaproteobacteria bacterium]